MAKKSAIEKNKSRIRKVIKFSDKRKKLKAIIMNKRCELSGRPRGFYRRVKLSRIALRDLAASGQIPGMIKASW